MRSSSRTLLFKTPESSILQTTKEPRASARAASQTRRTLRVEASRAIYQRKRNEKNQDEDMDMTELLSWPTTGQKKSQCPIGTLGSGSLHQKRRDPRKTPIKTAITGSRADSQHPMPGALTQTFTATGRSSGSRRQTRSVRTNSR